MQDAQQLIFLGSSEMRSRVVVIIKDILMDERQPSARELVAELDREVGIVARWDLESVLASLLSDKDVSIHLGVRISSFAGL